ncbi:MAG: hypothetical protein CHACPFDD_02282 [Phycisphaerae bacterium]|nr:hypothetical protein [Phycisphaerae bacterium]
MTYVTGMEPVQTSEVFLPLHRAASRLGVPATWLRTEALAGRVPHLRVGRRLLFNPAAVEEALLHRASQKAKGIAHADDQG